MLSSAARAAKTIWIKELRETLRDRKTIIVMVVLPLVLYPMIFLGLSQATMMQQSSIEGQQMTLGVAGAPLPPELEGRLEALEHTEIRRVEDPQLAIASGEVLAALEARDGTIAALARGDQATLDILFDGSDDHSREAERRLKSALNAFTDALRQERLEQRGIRAEYIEPVRVEARNVAPPERQGGWLLGQIIPLLVSMLMIGATFYPAIDLTAGEKERGTLQTLLTAPIPSGAIVAGKFLAVVTLALITGVMNLLSVALVAINIPLPDQVAGEIAFDLGAGPLLLTLICLLLLGMMFGAVMMAVAVTAKSFKEAQNYLTPLYIICIFPLMLSGLPGVELSSTTAVMPLINLALAIKQLLLGTVSVDLLLITFLSTLAWIALALVLAARVFRMESVLLGEEGLKALFQRRGGRVARSEVPTLGEVVTLLGVVLLLLFYGSLMLSGSPLLVIIHTTQWVFLLAPVVLLIVALKLSPRQTLALRRPPAWGLGVALLCGAGFWVVAKMALEALTEGGVMPVPTPAMQALEEQLAALGSDPLSAVALFLGIALAPAICEEALFRGVVLQSLRRRFSATASVVASSLLFGVYHLNIHQLPTTVAIGLVLGTLTLVTRSIWPAVLLHAMHNALALGTSLYFDGGSASWLPLLSLGPVLGLALLGVMARRARRAVST